VHALLGETRAVRQLLEAPRPPVRPESVPLVEAARVLGCSKRRVEQLLKEGSLRAGPRFGKRAMVTVESIEAALQPKRRSATRRNAREAAGRQWLPIDRTRLR
jgi:excisionase family DNA binding protein